MFLTFIIDEPIKIYEYDWLCSSIMQRDIERIPINYCKWLDIKYLKRHVGKHLSHKYWTIMILKFTHQL